MITDRQAADIESQRREGVMGPVVLAWVDRLLADRRERVKQLRYLQARLRQAFRYLDKLFAAPDLGTRPQRPAEQRPPSSPGSPDRHRPGDTG
jgi:hypothetical protein